MARVRNPGVSGVKGHRSSESLRFRAGGVEFSPADALGADRAAGVASDADRRRRAAGGQGLQRGTGWSLGVGSGENRDVAGRKETASGGWTHSEGTELSSGGQRRTLQVPVLGARGHSRPPA